MVREVEAAGLRLTHRSSLLANPGALARVEWIKFVAAFFNLEPHRALDPPRRDAIVSGQPLPQTLFRGTSPTTRSIFH